MEREVMEKVTVAANKRIVEVIGQYVQLHQSGANWVGCCPFHNEVNTESLTVMADKGMYICHGCHVGGNAVNFFMLAERLDYTNAIRELGKRLGIEVVDETQSAEEAVASRGREGMYQLMEYACKSFERELKETPEGQAEGLVYFRGRKFTDATIERFRLGYSPRQRDAMMSKAVRDGYSVEFQEKVGLVAAGESGVRSDKFKGRVIFPIQNEGGSVIAFAGRLLDARTKGVTVKYLNSPETELYHKSDIVYGIYQAKEEMMRTGKCYMMEGYTDVMSMSQAGIENVVASSGTALTVNQIRLVKRFTKSITLMYDSDSAGVHAAMRAIDMVLHEGMGVKVLLLPDGDDPDSFAQREGHEGFMKYAEENESDFVSFEVKVLMKEGINDTLKKAGAIHTIVNSIAEVQDQAEREACVKRCSELMQVREQTIFNELQKRMTENAVKQRDEDVKREQAAMMEELRQQEAMAQMQAYGQPAGMSGYQQPAGVNIAMAARPETEFREIIRYLLKYTQRKILVKDWGSKQVYETLVGEYIVGSLDTNQFVSYDPILQRIVDTYRTAADRSVVDTEYYLNMPDPEMTRVVAEIVGRRQELSRIYSKRGGDEEGNQMPEMLEKRDEEKDKQMLGDLVVRAVNELQLRRVIEIIDGITAELNRCIAAGDEEAANEQLDLLSRWTKVKRGLGKEMGDRALIR
ncbi:MAG: DNA primase [Bacteroidales bacterium]|nr:DNA primase [Bacteroidales bacterium]